MFTQAIPRRHMPCFYHERASATPLSPSTIMSNAGTNKRLLNMFHTPGLEPTTLDIQKISRTWICHGTTRWNQSTPDSVVCSCGSFLYLRRIPE